MRVRKQETMDKIKAAVEAFYKEKLRSPSPQEIADQLGMDRTTVWRYLKSMNQDSGVDYRVGDSITTEYTHKVEMEIVSIPIAGSIPCGSPEECEEAIDVYLPFPRALIGPGEFFILKANGDSMVDAGIDDGDLVIIRKGTEAKVGQIVAALCEGVDSTLKTLEKDEETGRLYLKAENASYPTSRRKIMPQNFTIQGIAVRVIKSLANG